MRELYPDDCADTCSEVATWDVWYTEHSGYNRRRERKRMGACDDHLDAVTRAAQVTHTCHFGDDIEVKPHRT